MMSPPKRAHIPSAYGPRDSVLTPLIKEVSDAMVLVRIPEELSL